jgi:tetratricopeptide (TPR) repeat protein
MAPEQFEDVKRVDVRADIYSFGILLFEMVAGRLPFIGRSFAEFRTLHQTQVAPELPTDHSGLRTIAATCLAKNPAERFGDFKKLRVELSAVYTDITGTLPPAPAQGTELQSHDLVNKGASLHHLGRDEAALACYERALKLDPNYAKGWQNKGSAVSGLGQKDDALKNGRRACELLPITKDAIDGAALAVNLAQIYAWTGEKDLALEQIADGQAVPARHELAARERRRHLAAGQLAAVARGAALGIQRLAPGGLGIGKHAVPDRLGRRLGMNRGTEREHCCERNEDGGRDCELHGSDCIKQRAARRPLVTNCR